MQTQKTLSNIPYQLFILSLSVFVVGLLFFDTAVEADEETKTLLKWTDYSLCVLFFIDFMYQVFTIPDRKRYLMTWGLVDFISCIPVFGWGRIARILRIIKLLKAIRSVSEIFKASRLQIGESAIFTAIVFLISGVVFGSVAILQCEIDETAANIKTASDAVWWTFCMILKGGCEGYDPISTEGRFVAVALMFLGMAINGAVIGCVTLFMTSGNKTNENDPPTNENSIST